MNKFLSIFILLVSLQFSFHLSAQDKCTCPKCNGEGMCDENFARPCNYCTGGYNSCGTCGGDGQEACYRCNETGIVQMTCEACHGSGKVNDETCGACGGDGQVDQTCINCGGKGWNTCHSCGGQGRTVCNMCGGAGEKVWRNTCPTCGGSGQVNCE